MLCFDICCVRGELYHSNHDSSFSFSWWKYQVDAMAATKMLTQLLRSDNIAYNLKPVANFDEVVQSMQDLVTSDIKTVFLINCGAVSFLLLVAALGNHFLL